MREVCFVNRLEFEFSGNVFQNALALGDVNNDGENELIVGNLVGELSIFKHDQLWHKLSGLGMITAIAVGDILNCKSNALVVVSGDGWVHIFIATPTKSSSDVEPLELNEKLTCHHVQRIPANTKVALLEDVDSDGNIEFLIGLTDRVIRSYRWMPAKNNSPARLQVLNKWECANQVGTMTVNKSPEEGAALLVSQPGGSYMKICCDATHRDFDASFRDGDGLSDSSVEYHPLSLARMRNANVSTEILGGFETPLKDGLKISRYAVATLDGTITLVDNQEILWSLQVDNQVFSLKGLDVTGDGKDEIIACAWNGQTYILDQERRSVKFQLEEAVTGFTAGLYVSQPGGHKEPCLAYTTFTNKLYVYRNVRLPSMVTSSVHLDIGLDETQSRELVEWCLYGPNLSTK